MRIEDGSICSNYLNFDHDCNTWEEDWEEDLGCMESCECEDENIKNKFYRFEEIILECKCFVKY